MSEAGLPNEGVLAMTFVRFPRPTFFLVLVSGRRNVHVPLFVMPGNGLQSRIYTESWVVYTSFKIIHKNVAGLHGLHVR